MNRSRLGGTLVLALLLGCALGACASGATPSDAAATVWPAFMPSLQPGPSDSPIAIEPLAGATVRPPADDVPADRARWSGSWDGWAGQDRVDAIGLVVERVTAEGATIVVSSASAAREPWSERLTARFVDGELRAMPRPGTRINYRMRDADTLELLWQADGGGWLAGVLGRSGTHERARPSAVRSVERVPVGAIGDGEPVELETVLFTPDGDGPFPTLLFNHGSTGRGDDPGLFDAVAINPAVTRFFTERGWLVAFPQRRGRGGSGGAYAEGLAADGSGYSSDPDVALAGVDRALTDIDTAFEWLRARPEVDDERLLIGGESRGGVLSIAYAGEHPDTVRGAINFVGGWLGDRVPNAGKINAETFRRGAGFPGPTLWLYGDEDPFYRLEHSRDNFAAFTGAGGTGTFHEVPVEPGWNGHFIGGVSGLWDEAVDGYLQEIGLADARPIAQKSRVSVRLISRPSP